MKKSMNTKVLAMDLIRHIGETVQEKGRPIRRLSSLAQTINAPSEEIAESLFDELTEQGLIRVRQVSKSFQGRIFMGVNLGLEG